MSTRRILSGVQPTGNLHLGNYLGAIRNWARMQSDYECLFCVVDLHAFTVAMDHKVLAQNTREIAAAFIAGGVDPETNTIFVQSAVPGHSELAWLLSCQTPLGWLNRMTQFKEKAGKRREQSSLGLYAYPVLMAADILVYKATHVPVGEDQKQHLELARDIAQSFNQRFDVEYFPLPEPQILGPTPRVMSLRDGSKKMSKSDESDLSRINMMDDADTIATKVRKAKTDPEPIPESTDGFEGRPEAGNLLRIYSALADQEMEAVLNEWGGKTFSELKKSLTDVAVGSLAPVADEMRRLLGDPDELDRILKRGNENARAIAATHMGEVQDLMGMLRL
ncbi:MAG: tryptophan--tRNA ligase [Myxococcota bacterium]